MQQYRKNLGKVSLTAEGVWEIKSKYDVLSIVYDEHTQHGFISKQPVPIGVDLYNSEYWMPLNVSGYTDSNIIILNKKTSDASIETYTLEEAVKSIASVGRKPGCILGFYNSNVNRLDIGGRWEIWQFNSTTISEWEDLANWQNIYYNYNQFVGWYRNEEQLKINNPYPEVGCYAYVGNILNEAVVYRCEIKHKWAETVQRAWDYVKIMINGTVNVGENGNWFNDGEDTGIPASIKGEPGNTPFIRYNSNSNKLEYSYNKEIWHEISDYISTWFRLNNNKLEMSRDNANWNPVSDYIAAWFRWQATSGDTQANNVGRIQISRDNGNTWTNMSNDFINNLHISRYIGVNESLPTSGIAEGTIYAKGPYYAEGDTSNDNPIYRLWVYAWKGDTLAWQDNGEFTGITAGIVQETGNSETEVMSQKAVTDKLSKVEAEIGKFASFVEPKLTDYWLIKEVTYKINVTDLSQNYQLFVKDDFSVTCDLTQGRGEYLFTPNSSGYLYCYPTTGTLKYTIIAKDSISEKIEKLDSASKESANDIININNDIRLTRIYKSKTDNHLDITRLIYGMGYNKNNNKLEKNPIAVMSSPIYVKGVKSVYISGLRLASGANIACIKDTDLSSVTQLSSALDEGRSISIPKGTLYIIVTLQFSSVDPTYNNAKLSFSTTPTTDVFDGKFFCDFGREDIFDEDRSLIDCYTSQTSNLLDVENVITGYYYQNGKLNANPIAVISKPIYVEGLKRLYLSECSNSLSAIFLESFDDFEHPMFQYYNQVMDRILPVPPKAKYCIISLMGTVGFDYSNAKLSCTEIVTTNEYKPKYIGEYGKEYQYKEWSDCFIWEKFGFEKRAIPMSIGCDVTEPNGANQNISYQRFNMMFMSDSHIDWDYADIAKQNVDDAVNLINRSQIEFKCMIHGGDFINPFGIVPKETAKADATKYFNIIKKCKVPVLQALGNHDLNDWENTISNVLTDEDWGDLYFNWLETRCDIQRSNGSIYFYKDFSEEKVRIISLNLYDYPKIEEDGKIKYFGGYRNCWIGQAQMDWFVNTALSVDEGWSIIVLCHHEYSHIVANSSGSVQTYGYTLLNVLRAFVNKSSYAITINAFDNISSDYHLEINANFANAKGTLIGMFNGHEHYDRLRNVDGVNIVTIASSHPNDGILDYPGENMASDGRIRRIIGTTTQNCFDIVSIDTKLRRVYLTRFGAGLMCNGKSGGWSPVDNIYGDRTFDY